MNSDLLERKVVGSTLCFMVKRMLAMRNTRGWFGRILVEKNLCICNSIM